MSRQALESNFSINTLYKNDGKNIYNIYTQNSELTFQVIDFKNLEINDSKLKISKINVSESSNISSGFLKNIQNTFSDRQDKTSSKIKRFIKWFVFWEDKPLISTIKKMSGYIMILLTQTMTFLLPFFITAINDNKLQSSNAFLWVLLSVVLLILALLCFSLIFTKNKDGWHLDYIISLLNKFSSEEKIKNKDLFVFITSNFFDDKNNIKNYSTFIAKINKINYKDKNNCINTNNVVEFAFLFQCDSFSSADVNAEYLETQVFAFNTNIQKVHSGYWNLNSLDIANLFANSITNFINNDKFIITNWNFLNISTDSSNVLDLSKTKQFIFELMSKESSFESNVDFENLVKKIINKLEVLNRYIDLECLILLLSLKQFNHDLYNEILATFDDVKKSCGFLHDKEIHEKVICKYQDNIFLMKNKIFHKLWDKKAGLVANEYLPYLIEIEETTYDLLLNNLVDSSLDFDNSKKALSQHIAFLISKCAANDLIRHLVIDLPILNKCFELDDDEKISFRELCGKFRISIKYLETNSKIADPKAMHHLNLLKYYFKSGNIEITQRILEKFIAANNLEENLVNDLGSSLEALDKIHKFITLSSVELLYKQKIFSNVDIKSDKSEGLRLDFNEFINNSLRMIKNLLGNILVIFMVDEEYVVKHKEQIERDFTKKEVDRLLSTEEGAQDLKDYYDFILEFLSESIIYLKTNASNYCIKKLRFMEDKIYSSLMCEKEFMIIATSFIKDFKDVLSKSSIYLKTISRLLQLDSSIRNAKSDVIIRLYENKDLSAILNQSYIKTEKYDTKDHNFLYKLFSFEVLRLKEYSFRNENEEAIEILETEKFSYLNLNGDYKKDGSKLIVSSDKHDSWKYCLDIFRKKISNEIAKLSGDNNSDDLIKYQELLEQINKSFSDGKIYRALQKEDLYRLLIMLNWMLIVSPTSVLSYYNMLLSETPFLEITLGGGDQMNSFIVVNTPLDDLKISNIANFLRKNGMEIIW